MNEHVEIKELLDKYYQCETSVADVQRLKEYFTSDNIAAELQPYRAIFACLQHERENPSEDAQIITLPAVQPRRFKLWYAAAAIAACLSGVIFLVHKHQSAAPASCTGTFVMVNGVCSSDMSILKKYAVETIDLITQPVEDSYQIETPNHYKNSQK